MRIVIAGGGSAGWMTAAALSRFLPLEAGPGGASGGEPARFSVTLVESDAIGTIGVGEATIPQIRQFNQALGIDEAAFLAATGGSLKLGIEFDGWHGAPYLHAFGPVGRPLGGVAFHQLWARARAAGEGRPLGAFVHNDVAARAGRVGAGSGSPVAPVAPGAVPPAVQAYHFDAARYAGMLRRYAEARGVVRREGRIGEVERAADGAVTALRLAGGEVVGGDLFIDCTGFAALLIGQALGVGFESWAEWLPCDRALAVPCARTEPILPYTRAIAHRAGWRWRIPLRHRTGNGVVYSSAHLTDEAARALLLEALDGEPLAEPRPIRFEAGRRAQAFAHNVVAIGLAAGFLEPLESTSIHLVQTAIERLLTLLPNGRPTPAARAAFNRQTAAEYEGIRDFLVLHYAANDRVGEPFWDALRTRALPASLAERIDLFRATGQVEARPGELFTEPGWVQVLIGQGVVPEGWHPLADVMGPGDLRDYLDLLAGAYARSAAGLPTHEAALDAALAAASRPREPRRAP